MVRYGYYLWQVMVYMGTGVVWENPTRGLPVLNPICVVMPSDPSVQSRRHCLDRLTEHQNHLPLEEAQPLLPGTLSDCGEGVITCILTWSVPSSVAHSSCVPCVTAATH